MRLLLPVCAGVFFFNAGNTFAAAQFGKNVVCRQAEVMRQHQRMKPQIGHFPDELGRLTIFRRHDGLSGFFRHFFADGIRAFGVRMYLFPKNLTTKF